MNNAWNFTRHRAKPYKHGNYYRHSFSLLTNKGSRDLSKLINSYVNKLRSGGNATTLKKSFANNYSRIEARDRANYNEFMQLVSEQRAKEAEVRKAAESARRANNNLKRMVAELTKSIKKNQQKLRPASNALAGLAQLRANLKHRLIAEYKRANVAGNERAIGRISRSLTGLRSPQRQRR
jgi:hypothetical protein